MLPTGSCCTLNIHFIKWMILTMKEIWIDNTCAARVTTRIHIDCAWCKKWSSITCNAEGWAIPKNLRADDDNNRRTYSYRNEIKSHSGVVLLVVNNEHMCLCWYFTMRRCIHRRWITQSITIRMNQNRAHINTPFHSHCDLRVPTMMMTQ